MAVYPIKMLKDEDGKPFVPLVSTGSVKDSNNIPLQDILDKKLENTNIKPGENVSIVVEGNDVTISSSQPTILIDNLEQEEAGEAALDAHQGKVLKELIPKVINNLTTETSGEGVLDAAQGKVLKGLIPTVINNLTTSNSGVGVLDAYQGKVLHDSIPTVINNLTTTEAAQGALDAYQGKVLSDRSVPSGGASGQVLKKSSNSNWALEWGDAADPNAIVGDGTIKKIIEITLADYQVLENEGKLDPGTEYHIITQQEAPLMDITSILDLVYPIGRGFIDFTDTDYSNYLGFTWERELVGMTAVGLDTSQTEFNTIGKTGGSKYLQRHIHKLRGSADNFYVTEGGVGRWLPNYDDGPYAWATQEKLVDIDDNEILTGTSGNLQPYQVVAYWKRVA